MTYYHHLLYGDTGDKRDYKELHGVKGAYKRLKGVIKGDRGLQRVKDYKRLEWVTKVLQEVEGWGITTDYKNVSKNFFSVYYASNKSSKYLKFLTPLKNQQFCRFLKTMFS